MYGGYATLYRHGIAFHLTENRAVLLPFSEMAAARNKIEFKLTRGFYLYGFSGRYGNRREGRSGDGNSGGRLLQTVAGIAPGHSQKERSATHSKCVIVCLDKEGIRVSVRIILVFNFFAVIYVYLLSMNQNEQNKAKGLTNW